MGNLCGSKAALEQPTLSAVPTSTAPVKRHSQQTTTDPKTDNTTAVEQAKTAPINTTIAETATSTPKSDNEPTTITHTSPSWEGKQQPGEAPEPERQEKNPYQDMLNEKLMEMGDNMANHLAANESTLLAPIDGWSLEKYATVQAHIAKNAAMYDTVLEKHGITKSQWEAIDQGWQQRMKDDRDTGAVMVQYGKYYMAAGTGDYGTSAKEAAAVMNIVGVSTGEAPSPGGEADQVPFDKYLEWMGAQGAWSSLGLDVNAKLKEVFGITAHDYSNVAGYWSMKMMSDMNLAMKMGTDMQKWTAVYMQHPNGPPK